MKTPAYLTSVLLAANLLGTGDGHLSAADRELTITGFADFNQAPVPIALTGYSGEVSEALRFDLAVVGFKIVSEADAQYVLKGGTDGRVQGQLTDAITKAVKLSKAYSGGTVRAQAHALADDVVQTVTGQKGIARTKIAFRMKKAGNTGAGEIVVSDYDGFNSKTVTSDNVIVAAPSVLPGRMALFYMTHKFNNADIVFHDLVSGDRKLVARYSGSNISPAASPDGRQVALILSKAGSPDVYVANWDGTGLRQLTQTKEDESSPTWSPDGKWICFATKRSGRRVLVKVSVDGGRTQSIPTAGVPNPSEPDWSPDGKWIAFTSQAGGFDVCVIPASGGEARVLVGGEDPSWAPNSRTLVYVRRTAGGERGLSMLDVPTKQTKDVRGFTGNCSQPSWAR